MREVVEDSHNYICMLITKSEIKESVEALSVFISVAMLGTPDSLSEN